MSRSHDSRETSEQHQYHGDLSNEIIRRSEKQLIAFAHRYKHSVRKSSLKDEDLKKAAVSSIQVAVESYPKLLSNIHKDSTVHDDLENSINTAMIQIKIEIVICAIQAKASYTVPPPTKISQNSSNAGSVIIGNAEVALDHVWNQLNKHANDDFNNQKQFLTKHVMKDVIEKATFLPQGERMYREQQVKSVKAGDSCKEMVSGRNKLFYELTKPSKGTNAMAYAKNVEQQYEKFNWEKYGRLVFVGYEDVSHSIEFI